MFGFTDRYRVEGTVRKLNELGFAVDEVSLQPVGDDPGQLKLHVAVGDRRYHAQRLQKLTGLDVGEGQARIGKRLGRFPEERAPAVIAAVARLYAADRRGDETFRAFIKRVGTDRLGEVAKTAAAAPA